MFLYKTEPFAHQRAALAKGARQECFALFMEQSTGKSKILTDNAAYLYQRGLIDTVVILAPNGVHRQWIDETIPEHLPDWVPVSAHFYRSGLVNKEFWHALQRTSELVILALNSELLSSKAGVKTVSRCFNVEGLSRGAIRAVGRRKVLFIVDESHHFKTPSAKRTRALWSLGEQAVAKRIATGTEIAKGLEDLYAQMRFLDWRIIGAKTYTEFKVKHCVVVVRKFGSNDAEEGPSAQWSEITGYQNVDELMRRIEPYCFVAEKKDCQDLPPQVFMEPTLVELTSEQKRLMKELRDNYVTQLPTGEVIDAALAITRLQRFQQITGGHVSTGEKQWQPVDTAGIRETVRIVEDDCRGQVLVWCAWQPDIIQLSAAFAKAKIKHVTYYGGNSNSQNDANKAKFKSDPSVRVMIMSYAKAEGHNLNEADSTIFYTLTFDSVDYWQAIARNHRPGRTTSTTYYTIVRPGSSDRKLLAALRRKEDLRKILRDPTVFKQWLNELLQES